ncbi:MAG: peptide chain release factor N(5)-glutamine methyltransferase [Parvularculales bacterium]
MAVDVEVRGKAEQIWRALAVRFDKAGIPSPILDAQVLLCEAAGWSSADLARFSECLLSSEAMRHLEVLEKARLSGMPVARLLGRREFWSLDFKITPATLLPRPDSETLVEACLERIMVDAPARFLDLGCGSGCLLLSLLMECPKAWGVGVDCHDSTLRVARHNAARLGCLSRAVFCVGDWTGPLRSTFDIILSNPPYIPTDDIKTLSPEVRFYDPLIALDGGQDGLDAIRLIVSRAGELLIPGGWLGLEVGAGQVQETRRLMEEARLENIASACDLSGIERVVMGQRL